MIVQSATKIVAMIEYVLVGWTPWIFPPPMIPHDAGPIGVDDEPPVCLDVPGLILCEHP